MNLWTSGVAHTVISAVGSLALLVWAVLEIGWGVNWFRRALGTTAAVATIVGSVQKII